MEFELNSGGLVDIRTGVLNLPSSAAFAAGASFIGDGVTRLTGGSSTYTFTGAIGGTSLEFAAGMLAGSGTLTDGMTWTGGLMTGANSLTVGADATLVLAGAGAKNMTGAFVMTNEGVIVFQDTGSLAAHSGPTIVNRGLFEIRNDALFDYLNAGANLVFDNQGTLRKTAGEGASTMEFALNNSSEVDIQTGVLNLPSSSTFSDGASFIGVGVTRLVGGSSTYTFTGNIGGSSLEFAAGVIAGSGTLTDGMTWTGGLLTGANSLTVGADATLTLSGTTSKSMTGVCMLINDGTIHFEGTGSIAAHSGPTIVNRGLFEIRNDALFDYANVGANLVIDNQGTLRKTTATGVTAMEFQVNNSGVVEFQSGVLNFISPYTQTAGSATLAGGDVQSAQTMSFQGGTLGGSGTIMAAVNNTGAMVTPGTSAGALTITGSYTQNSGGALAIEIGGTGQGTQFDHLSVSGTATLNGALQLSRINTFAPAPTDTFEILTAASVSGTFSSITGTDAAGGNFFDIAYNPANVTLAVKNGAASVANGSFTYNAGQFGFQISGIADQMYKVQGTQDYVTWTDIETRTLSVPTWDFVDPNPDQLTRRFYRIVFLPR